MCRFKSGIILKKRVVIAQADNDSHSDLLELLKIDDTRENAMTKFVRAECIPPNDEWWTDPNTWKCVVDQDILPDWFKLDKEKYIADFKAAVKEWWSEHVLIDQKIDELSSGYYRLKRCEVKKLLNDVKVMCDSSSVQEMYGSSSVQRMYDSSSVQRMYGSSSVQRMCDSSSVQRMYGSSSVQEMYGSSSVQEMYDSSSVQRMYGSSSVQEMYGSSSVQEMYDSSSVQEMYGSSIARDSKNEKILISKDCPYEVTAI